MLAYARVLMLCTVAGYLLPVALLTPEAAVAGAVKGFFIGVLIALGQSNSKNVERKPVFISQAASPFAMPGTEGSVRQHQG